MESCWTYPDSEEFKKSVEAKELCFKLTKTEVSNTLGADIQALVDDAKSHADRRVYSSNGKIRSDMEIMTDSMVADFDGIKRIRKALVDDFKIAARISDIKQGAMIKSINNELMFLNNKNENQTANAFAGVLDDIREQCEEQLFETIQDVAVGHERDNNRMIENIKFTLESELLPLQEKYREVQAEFDQISMEYEKVKLDALQSYTILKKHNLLPENLRIAFTQDEESKLSEILNVYRKTISEKDDIIQNLKKQISKLEIRTESQSSNKRNSVTSTLSFGHSPIGGRSSVVGRPSIAGTARRSLMMMPLDFEGNDEIPTVSEYQQIDEPDYSRAEELEKQYQEDLEKLKARNEKELEQLREKREKLYERWQIKSKSVTNLQINSKLQKIVKKQNILLNLATKARPRPDCHKEVAAHLAGATLRHLCASRLQSMTLDASISSETQAYVNETMQSMLFKHDGETSEAVNSYRKRSSSFSAKRHENPLLKEIGKSSTFYHRKN